MGLPIVYRLVARDEILAAARTYEEQRRGMGDVFLDEVARIEGHLSDSPRLYQLTVADVRRAVLRRFPFALFYVEEEHRIVVLGCFDLRRDPDVAVAAMAARRDQ